MNTPAHLIFGVAAFGNPGRRGTAGAALLGALAPDLSLYLLAGVSLFILGIPESVVFGQLYFSDRWQTVFAIDNSVFLWGGILAAALWRRMPRLTAFAAAGLLHLALDFPLHHDDGRPHFWPVSDWVFESPVSYWDGRHHAGVVAPLEVLASVGLAALAFARHRRIWLRALLALLVALEFLSGGAFYWMF